MRILATPTHETRNERREPDPPRERDRRDAPAGTWQAAQAERQRQAASHLPAPKRQEAAHEQRRAPSAPAGESAAARPDAEGAPHARVEARRGHEGGAGREGGAGGREPAGAVATRAVAAPPPDALEAGLIDAIAAQAPGQDLFELLLPGGERLGVLLAPGGDQVLRILLSCSNAGLRRRLDQKSMELEQGLARRMQQATRLTVL
jgi:hypothetical protein